MLWRNDVNVITWLVLSYEDVICIGLDIYTEKIFDHKMDINLSVKLCSVQDIKCGDK